MATALLPMVVGCTDDSEEQEPRDVSICVQALWQNGLTPRRAPGAMPATDILAAGTADITIAYADYPATIDVSCSDGTDFTLSKGAALCGDHTDFWQYTPSVIYKDKNIIRDNLTFTATATIDEGDELTGEATQADLHDQHLQFTLHHTKALLRFSLKVSEKYNKVCYIRVTGISLNGNDCPIADKVLSTDGQLIAYAYIDPTVVTVSHENTIQCTYNIYDKDEATDAHLTRKGVTAQNHFTLSALKDASSNPVTTIRAGYYYDLKVTLDPTYMYVLPEHGNKHITIE